MQNLYITFQKGIKRPRRIIPFLVDIYDDVVNSKSQLPRTFRRTDYCVVSFPKSGRTWFRVILGKIISDLHNVPEDHELYAYLSYQLTLFLGLPRVYFFHDGVDKPLDREPLVQKKDYHSKRVIFLLRDVRDVMVSYYYHITKRENRFQGSISEFIRTEEFGIERYVRFQKDWYESQSIPRDFHVIRYEDMHQDIHRQVSQAMEFLNVYAEDELISSAIAFAAFKNMQKLEESRYFSDSSMQPASSDPNSFKVRKGEIGGYLSDLSDTDLEYIYQVVDKFNAPVDWIYSSK